MTTRIPSPCPIVTGTILRRKCGAAAICKCVRCAREICEPHTRHLQSVAGPADVCVECMPKQAATSSSSGTTSTTTSSGSSFSYDTVSAAADVAAWTENAGGQFGGGGASGGWTDDPAAGAPTDASGFTPADYAAFDSVADADKSSPGYDS